MARPLRANEPFIPATQSLPEITIKGVILGVLLAAILAGANAYLGLFAGMTVSASIPAAVISMGVLRFFRRSNILENNMVQTIASAGEALAAGVIFTIPALVMLGRWANFNFFQTLLIAGFGGTLGVLFTVPLRRALIVDEGLQFPEGIACAQVLETGERGGAGLKYVAGAALVSALYKFAQTGLRLYPEQWEVGGSVAARKTIAYLGTNLSPALIAVGYIIGLNIAVLVFAGGAINWWIAIPIYTATHGGVPIDQSAVDYANTIWATQTRYLGVGAMILGGLWALVRLGGSVLNGIKSGLAAYRASRAPGGALVERTDRDIPMQLVLGAVVAAAIPLFLLYHYLVGGVGMTLVMAVIMIIAGFLFSAVAGYMAGLVGSSNNPISGVTIATIVFAALLLLVLFGRGSDVGPAAAIMIGAVVACAAAIAGDNLQDLKTGYLVGSTPWKQEVMLAVGTLVSAVVMAPVLNLLLAAYGIGPRTPAHPSSLTAPQATLMASVAHGVFRGGLPWGMVFIGMLVAVAIIVFDQWQEHRKSTFRTPVLAVAVGIYLPFSLSTPILVGGLLAWGVSRAVHRRQSEGPAAPGEVGGATEGLGGPTADTELEQRGLLLSSGFITGEALVGIAMAIPIVIAGRTDVMAFWGVHEAAWPGLLILALICYGLYRAGKAL
jgi:putative OPT family oligopeptide transporter